MKLFSEDGQQQLCQALPGYCIRFHRVLDSTNLCCQQYWQSDRQKKWLVLADEQTSGRGRYSRNWQSPPGANIYLSFVAADPFAGQIGYLNLFWGIVVFDTITALYGDFGGQLTLKWPNDLYLGDGKLAGILIQCTSDSQQIIVGIGINVYSEREQLPEAATSLRIAAKVALGNQARLDIIRTFFARLTEMTAHYRQFPGQVIEQFQLRAQRSRMVAYTYSSAHYYHQGLLDRLHPDGTAVIRTLDGEYLHVVT